MKGKMAYVIVSLEDQKTWQVSGPHSRDFVSEFGHVREFQAWAIFSEKEADGKHLYDGSLRSKTAALNDLAAEYHGGGHKNASGVKNLTRQDIEDLTAKIAERL
jgi:phosphoesterase RecJ-like protein